MRGFLLDTNVLSELRRPAADRSVRGFVAAQAEDTLFVSEVTFAEIRFGVEQQAAPQRRREIAVWLDRTLRPFFGPRALPLTEDVVLRSRLLLETGRRRGHVFSQLDLFLAATASENALVAVTRDTIHFIAAGVPTLNPWTGAYVDAAGHATVLSRLDSGDLLVRLRREAGRA